MNDTKQAAFRALSGESYTFDGDIIAGCKADEPTISAKQVNGILQEWLGFKLGTSAPKSLSGRLQQFALNKGAFNWSSLGDWLLPGGAVDKIVTSSSDVVDILYYNTAEDSDGGTWRTLTENTSWYNETLNTATRGATREFPRVSLIVAETDAVTIYDATDASLPMWMVFNSGGGRYVYVNGLTSISLLNGQLLVGAGATGLGGLGVISFIEDYGYLRIDSTSTFNRNSIADRNIVQPDTVTGTAPALVNRNINDVAMTVVDGAGLNPLTNAPYLTIGVATDGGLSAINPTGTAVGESIVTDSASTSAKQTVGFDHNGNLFSGEASAEDVIYYADFTSNNFASTQNYGSSSTPALISNNSGPAIVSLGDGEVFIGGPDGLSRVSYDLATQSSGMVAYITKDYNTGWQQGDIELAISDSLTDRSVSGTSVSGTTVLTKVETGAEQTAITATSDITATVTTGGSIYGWERIAGVWTWRPGSGWVGVSETGGTLTVLTTTVFSMLRYTNGTPSAAQYAKMYNDELPIFVENADCLLAGTSDAVSSISHVPAQGARTPEKLYVGTADGTTVMGDTDKSLFIRSAYIDNTGTQTSDTVVAVSGNSTAYAIGTSAEVVADIPAGAWK